LSYRQQIFDAAERADWHALLGLVADQRRDKPTASRGNINFVRPNDPTWLSLLHHAAQADAPPDVVQELLALGHFRSIRCAAGERPFDLASRLGRSDLLPLLEPVNAPGPPEATLGAFQDHFHKLIRDTALMGSMRDDLRLPPLEVLLEQDDLTMAFLVPFITIAYSLRQIPVPYALGPARDEWVLLARFSERMGDVERRYVITVHGHLLLERECFD
jgi:hypothetical protein